MLTEEEKKARKRAREQRWRESHRDELRAINRRCYHRNKEQRRARNREAYKALPIEERQTRRRKYRLKNAFGLTPEEYDKLLILQKNACAICGRPWKGGRRLAVDHDHRTKRVRGLLCTGCNLLIGNANDDPVILRAAICYLKRYR